MWILPFLMLKLPFQGKQSQTLNNALRNQYAGLDVQQEPYFIFSSHLFDLGLTLPIFDFCRLYNQCPILICKKHLQGITWPFLSGLGCDKVWLIKGLLCPLDPCFSTESVYVRGLSMFPGSSDDHFVAFGRSYHEKLSTVRWPFCCLWEILPWKTINSCHVIWME